MATQQPEDGEAGAIAGGAAPDAAVSTITPAGLARRNFARLGAGAGGVILTLASQPGMASAVCASASQSMSKWTSHHVGARLACSGRSPGYWQYHSWPNPYEANRKTLKFGNLFPCGSDTVYPNALVQTLCSPQKYDTANIGRHFVATYFNIQAGMINFLDIPTLQRMWYEYITTKQYVPTAGVKPWDATRIVTYLKSIMS